MQILALICLLSVVRNILGATPVFTELETLKPSQKAALEKLKNAVSSIVPYDYMREDIYLLRWLQVTGFSARKAEDMIKESLKWRQQVKLDEWEDPRTFAEFEKKGEYSVYDDGVDREGRPIIESFYGDWDVRAVAVQGKIKQLTYYSLRGVERSTKKVRELQAQGKNVTQWILLLNMDGFNVINQACPTCFPLYLGFVSQYEKNWPNSIYRTLLINTPDSFEIILNLIRPLMSPQTRAGLKIFGANKSEWKSYLDELIDPREISDWYDPLGKERRQQ